MKSDRCLFVGYPKETMGYYFYNSLEQKVFVSKHAVFLEKEFLLSGDSGSKVDLEEVQETNIDIDQPIDLEPVANTSTESFEPSNTQKS